MTDCTHQNIHCLNQYEFIRKYRCSDCCAVMMCLCDQPFGEKFLSHQLAEGTEIETQERVRVTDGFQLAVCQECRGQELSAFPKAEMYGAISKIKRYYWREIYFETTQRFFQSFPEAFDDAVISGKQYKDARDKIEKQVIEEIKAQHKLAPKYKYEEEAQSLIIEKFKVHVEETTVQHIQDKNGKGSVLLNGECVTAEEFACEYYIKKGYEVIFAESRPFHVLFGIYMGVIIQSYDDVKNRLVGFTRPPEGDHTWTLLPTDFGTSAYFRRRQGEIEKHLSLLTKLENLFEYGLMASVDLRKYLWAMDAQDVKKPASRKYRKQRLCFH